MISMYSTDCSIVDWISTVACKTIKENRTVALFILQNKKFDVTILQLSFGIILATVLVLDTKISFKYKMSYQSLIKI
jgi:hypothetical protein